MQSTARFVFLEIKQFEGKKEKTKGQIFNSMTLLQGNETFDVMLNSDQLEFFKDCNRYDQVEMEIATYLGNKYGVTVLGIRFIKLLKIVDFQTGEVIDLSPEIPASPALKAVPVPNNSKEAKAV